MKKPFEEITQADFQAYVDVQLSGSTNMFDTKTVEFLSGLDRETILGIMENYSELEKKYGVDLDEWEDSEYWDIDEEL